MNFFISEDRPGVCQEGNVHEQKERLVLVFYYLFSALLFQIVFIYRSYPIIII